MSNPTSLRLPAPTRERLRTQAARERLSASALAQRLIEEGLRMATHPGVVFRAGPAGRRPALAAGPDVAEVVSVLLHLDETGEAAVEEAARWLGLPVEAVGAALGYYLDFAEEVDDELSARRAAAEEELRRWERRERLLG